MQRGAGKLLHAMGIMHFTANLFLMNCIDQSAEFGAVCSSLSGADSCPSVMDETEDIKSSDAAEHEFLLQQAFDDVDGCCVRGLTGLYNHGNTCYANAAIQALSNWYVLSCCLLLSLWYCLLSSHHRSVGVRGGGIKQSWCSVHLSVYSVPWLKNGAF